MRRFLALCATLAAVSAADELAAGAAQQVDTPPKCSCPVDIVDYDNLKKSSDECSTTLKLKGQDLATRDAEFKKLTQDFETARSKWSTESATWAQDLKARDSKIEDLTSKLSTLESSLKSRETEATAMETKLQEEKRAFTDSVAAFEAKIKNYEKDQAEVAARVQEAEKMVREHSSQLDEVTSLLSDSRNKVRRLAEGLSKYEDELLNMYILTQKYNQLKIVLQSIGELGLKKVKRLLMWQDLREIWGKGSMMWKQNVWRHVPENVLTKVAFVSDRIESIPAMYLSASQKAMEQLHTVFTSPITNQYLVYPLDRLMSVWTSQLVAINPSNQSIIPSGFIDKCIAFTFIFMVMTLIINTSVHVIWTVFGAVCGTPGGSKKKKTKSSKSVTKGAAETTKSPPSVGNSSKAGPTTQSKVGPHTKKQQVRVNTTVKTS